MAGETRWSRRWLRLAVLIVIMLATIGAWEVVKLARVGGSAHADGLVADHLTCYDVNSPQRVFEVVLGQVVLGRGGDVGHFVRGYGFLGRAKRGAATGLDLDKGQYLTVAAHQVDFARGTIVVPRHERIAALRQKLDRDPLASVAQAPASVRHPTLWGAEARASP